MWRSPMYVDSMFIENIQNHLQEHLKKKYVQTKPKFSPQKNNLKENVVLFRNVSFHEVTSKAKELKH